MLLKHGKKAHFAKIMVSRRVFVEILSRDVVTSADFTTVDCKKGLQIFFAPYLARSALKVCSKKQKTAFISNFGSLWNAKKVKSAHFSCKFSGKIPKMSVNS